MPEFEYRARTAGGRTVRGRLIAQDVPNLKKKLEQQKLEFIDSSLGGKKTIATAFLGLFKNVPSVQKMFFTQYLFVMIRAGFSISRALDTLAQQTTSTYFKKVIADVRSDVEAGVSFSKSLAKFPRVFSELYVNMVAAGESSGKLDEVLSRLSVKMKKDHALLSKVKGALTYPIIIVVSMVVIGILMTVIVIPRLTEIFTESGASLPVPTKVLIALSSFLIHHGILTSVVSVAMIVASIKLIRTKRGRHIFDSFVLHLPIFGPIIRTISLARFTRSLSSLLETNIPIIETFLIIGRTMGNEHYRKALEETADRLRTGSTITKILERYPRLFPPLATQMIAVGEETGSLDSIAGELASFYEEEVDQTMANLSTIIEPVLMLVLGAGVAALAISILLPIYSLTQQIG